MIVVTGSLGFDYILNFPGRFADRIMPDKIHQISLSFLVDRMDRQWGGTAGNIAYTLGLFENRPILFATAGGDFAPYKKYLKKRGVDTSHVVQFKNISTGSYFVITDKEDNQIGAFYTGAMQYASQLPLTKLFQDRFDQDRPDFVIVAPNDSDAMQLYVHECRKFRVPYMYDPAFQIGNFSKRQLHAAVSGARVLIGNDYEIELIRQKLAVSYPQLLRMVPVVITTLGSKGAVINARDTMYDLRCTNTNTPAKDVRGQPALFRIKPAKPKNTSDPTGAGDAFRAGFVAGYVRGFDLQTCGQMGATAAVYTVEKYGTTTHNFTLLQFKKRYRENFGKTLSL